MNTHALVCFFTNDENNSHWRSKVKSVNILKKFFFFLIRVLLEQVDHWQEYLTLVNMILYCTNIPGYYPVCETTSSLTLTFWYTLQV